MSAENVNVCVCNHVRWNGGWTLAYLTCDFFPMFIFFYIILEPIIFVNIMFYIYIYKYIY